MLSAFLTWWWFWSNEKMLVEMPCELKWIIQICKGLVLGYDIYHCMLCVFVGDYMKLQRLDNSLLNYEMETLVCRQKSTAQVEHTQKLCGSCLLLVFWLQWRINKLFHMYEYFHQITWKSFKHQNVYILAILIVNLFEVYYIHFCLFSQRILNLACTI